MYYIFTYWFNFLVHIKYFLRAQYRRTDAAQALDALLDGVDQSVIDNAIDERIQANSGLATVMTMSISTQPYDKKRFIFKYDNVW